MGTGRHQGHDGGGKVRVLRARLGTGLPARHADMRREEVLHPEWLKNIRTQRETLRTDKMGSLDFGDGGNSTTAATAQLDH